MDVNVLLQPMFLLHTLGIWPIVFDALLFVPFESRFRFLVVKKWSNVRKNEQELNKNAQETHWMLMIKAHHVPQCM